ncbi:MAG TPA: condensation domain-containing protein, partial [Acetobacteraceae bacterium]|nr:condensation domain-containing protein [Acetobacteraceae bacterium]
SVSQAVVVARQDGASGTRLVGYVVGAADAVAAPEPAVLRASLSGVLPEHMVPSAIVVLERLPLTPNGKLDRRALPLPDVLSGRGYRAPRSPQEALLCALYAEVLGVDRVGIEDNFFELGGHSLLATRLISRIRAALSVEVPIRSLFEAPTVLALAAELQGAAGLPVRSALVRQPRPAELPLSYAQRRLWFLDRLEGPAAGGLAESGSAAGGLAQNSSAYVIPMAVRLEGALERGALIGALHDLIGRHESLRTVYPERSGVPRQQIVAAAAARLCVEVAGVGEAELEGALIAAASRGFELAKELPLRAHLFEVGSAAGGEERARAPAAAAALGRGSDQHVLLLVLHHIAGDGWSLGPLWRDLAAFYRARLAGGPAALPALSVQYADYTLWQRAALGEESSPDSALSRQLAYWKQALRDLPEQIELPCDRGRPAVSSHRGGSVPLALSAELHGGLLALGRSTGASLFMVLQAGLVALLSRLGAGTDIALGSPIAGRTDAALEELIGFFVNTLVLRSDVSGNPSFAELIG